VERCIANILYSNPVELSRQVQNANECHNIRGKFCRTMRNITKITFISTERQSIKKRKIGVQKYLTSWKRSPLGIMHVREVQGKYLDKCSVGKSKIRKTLHHIKRTFISLQNNAPPCGKHKTCTNYFFRKVPNKEHIFCGFARARSS